MIRTALLIISIGLMLCRASFAQVTLSFPFNGACRVGQYMPVRVTPTGSAALPDTITIAAEGVMPTTIDRPSTSVIVPVLVLRAPNRERQWTINGAPAERETDVVVVDDKVGFIVSNTRQSAYPLFLTDSTSARVINIDERTLLETPSAAWIAADQIDLGDTPLSSLSPDQIAEWLNAGVSISVTSVELSDRSSGWEPLIKGYWIQRPDPWLRRLGAINAEVYGPTSSWNPSYPLAFRRRVILWAVVVAIVVLAAAVFGRGKWKSAGLIALISLTACALLAVRARERSGVFHAGGTILVSRSSDFGVRVCEDAWTYEAAPQQGRRSHLWHPLTFPVFASQQQIDAMTMTLICDASGKPRSFEYDLPPEMRIAFVWRRVTRMDKTTRAPTTQATAVQSPLMSLVKSMYLQKGDVISQREESSDESPENFERWPSIILHSP